MSGTEAYLEANPEVSRGSAATQAGRLLKRVEIQAAIDELRAPVKQAVALSLIRKRELLADIAEGVNKEETRDRIRAMELDAKLAGELAQDKAADKQAAATSELAQALAKIREATHGS